MWFYLNRKFRQTQEIPSPAKVKATIPAPSRVECIRSKNLRRFEIRRQKGHKNIEAGPHTRRPAFEFVAEIRVKCGFMSRSKRSFTQYSKPASSYVLECAYCYCYTCYTCFHSAPSIYSFLFYNPNFSTFMCNSVTKGRNNKVVS